jgi:hypothetical protein
VHVCAQTSPIDILQSVIRGAILVLTRGYLGGMQTCSRVLERVLFEIKKGYGKWNALKVFDCFLHFCGII